MIRLFKHYISHAVVLLATIDVLLLLAAAEAGWQLRAGQIAMHLGGAGERLGQLAGFSAMMFAAMIAVGVYGPDALRSMRFATARRICCPPDPRDTR